MSISWSRLLAGVAENRGWPHRACRAAALVLPAALASAVTGAGLAHAAQAAQSAGQASTSIAGSLNGMAGTSVRNVWAVGYALGKSGVTRSLALHWNGRSWSARSTPNPGKYANVLDGVAMASATSAWAVGQFVGGVAQGALILRWNGTRWLRATAPRGGYYPSLAAVAATSRTSAWAVGTYCPASNCAPQKALMLHWNGTRWSAVKLPAIPGNSLLGGVLAISARNAWADGEDCPVFERCTTLMLHWNGTSWPRAPSPTRPAPGFELGSMSAASPSDVWAAGAACVSAGCGIHALPLLLHWNGTSWSYDAKTPDPGRNLGTLAGVSLASAGTGWAVGSRCVGGGCSPQKAVILRRNGKTWSAFGSPSPGVRSVLSGVRTFSASDAWAVGSVSGRAGSFTLILHWNGKAWSRA